MCHLFFDVLQLLLQLLHVGGGRRGVRCGRRGRRGPRAVVHVVRRGLRGRRLTLVHLHLGQVATAVFVH